MGLITVHGALIENIINGNGHFNLQQIECLSADEKYNLAVDLLNTCEEKTEVMNQVVRAVSLIIPYMASDKRYSCLRRLLSILRNAEDLYDKDVYDVLDFSVVESLQPLELLSLANILSHDMHSSQGVTREASMWGLIRLIPYLHSINQKEYAQDVCLMFSDPDCHQSVLSGLCALVFSLNQQNRLNLVSFFASSLKSMEDPESKFLTVELLKRVTASLPEKERVVVADCVAPLLYYTTSPELVKQTLDYFASVINLMPMNQRYHYTQLVAGMINDLSVRREVLFVIEKAIPFLSTECDRSEFRDILKRCRNVFSERDEERLALQWDE